MPTDSVTIEAARAAKDEAKRLFDSLDEVVGVGLTRGKQGYAVKINLAHAVAPDTLPHELQGVPLVIEVVGAIRKR